MPKQSAKMHPTGLNKVSRTYVCCFGLLACVCLWHGMAWILINPFDPTLETLSLTPYALRSCPGCFRESHSRHAGRIPEVACAYVRQIVI